MTLARTDIPIAPDGITVPLPWRVRSSWQELEDTTSFELTPRDGSKPVFTPGQFNMLYVPGVGDVPISISGYSEDGLALLHTVRSVGAVSAALCVLGEGGYVGVRGPLGVGWPVDAIADRDVVVIAGGLGLAPVRPAIQYAISREDPGGKTVVFYGSRSPSTLLYRDDIFQWAVGGDAEVRTTVDRGEPGWRGNVGVVTSILGRASFDAKTAIAFVCGPEVMMRFAVFDLLARGITGDRIFLSLERNMHCGVGVCGHCQLGPKFICTDGPVFAYDDVADLLTVRGL